MAGKRITMETARNVFRTLVHTGSIHKTSRVLVYSPRRRATMKSRRTKFRDYEGSRNFSGDLGFKQRFSQAGKGRIWCRSRWTETGGSRSPKYSVDIKRKAGSLCRLFIFEGNLLTQCRILRHHPNAPGGIHNSGFFLTLLLECKEP